MLTGRESLVRLIGKRRRSPLSPSLSLLLSSPSQASNPPPEVDASGGADKDSDQGVQEARLSGNDGNGAHHGVEWVPCPVCGESIRGTDYCVNTHLDICLTRGTKRRLTQSTLLDFRFSQKSRTEPSLSNLDNDEEMANIEPIDEEASSDSAFFSLCNPIASSRGSSSTLVCLHGSPNISETCNTCVLMNTVLSNMKDAANDKAVDQSSSCVLPTNIAAAPDTSTMIALDTVIVGRRFHENIELQQGAGITILRYPENAKDRNAIKVLYAGSEYGKMLGYLPRDLAKILAPLLDYHYIECEGFVVGVPEQQLDAVPVQLTCQKCTNSELRSDDLKYCDSLWENVIGAVENGKLHRPNITRYQTNFNLMIADVMANHAHLFSDKEKSFLGSFNSLSDDGQRLFIRVYNRKGPWFRMSNISYPEISDLLLAAEELKLAGYMYMLSCTDDPSDYDMKEVLDLLSVPEMREILKKELPKENVSCTRRHELLGILQSAYENGTCTVLPQRILKWTGTCIRISRSADEVLWRVQRLFFLNGDQDLSAFLLVDLGLVNFPDYVCNISHHIFRGRSDLIEYEEAIQVAQVMDESLDDNNMEMVTRCINFSDNRLCTIPMEENATMADPPPTFFSCFSATWVYSKILTLGVSVYEREHRYGDAIRILNSLLSKVASDSRRGYWTLRLSVDLEHMGRLNESLSTAEAGVLDSWVRAGSKMTLQRRVLRLGKPPRRWKVPNYADSVKRKIKEVNIKGRPLNCETGVKNVFYGYDGERCGVEQLALQYYADEGGGWQGTHSEGGIWMTIFGLLMWDVIFADIPDVFQSKFQIAPLDLETDDFYESRKDIVEAQLQKIQDGMAEEMLISSWELRHGTACRGVNWDRHSLIDLRAAVSCIGGRCLASLFRHLALDYKSWLSGMPDLLLWRFVSERGGGEAKFVEVKGPRDRLSEQQRAWILVLMDCGFDVEVCKVSPISKPR